MSDDSDRQALVAFVHDNPELERLESLVGQFNIFTALGLERYEIRHSNFLAWLFDPSGTHGLGDYFLKIFLRHVAHTAMEAGSHFPTVFDIDSWDLDDSEIRREWRNIDVLILNHEHRFVCLIENKVFSGQHSNQLERYKRIVETEYAGYQHALLYLHAMEDEPEQEQYIPFTYSELIPLIEQTVTSKRTLLSSEILTFLTHYTEMVRRHIMQDSEIQQICQQIYKRHRRALDLINEYIPASSSGIKQMLSEIIESDPDLIADDPFKNGVHFLPAALDWFPKVAQNWLTSNRIMLFNITIQSDVLMLSLYLGPGDQDFRKKVYDAVQSDRSLFNKSHRKLTPVWFCLYRTVLLSTEELDTENGEATHTLLKSKFEDFKKGSMQKIVDHLNALKATLVPPNKALNLTE